MYEYQSILPLPLCAGTTRGGVELQGFRSVGRRQHAFISGLSLSHETSLHVTVLARNAAGMTSATYSLPMTVDMTPPDIFDLWDGSSGEGLTLVTMEKNLVNVLTNGRQKMRKLRAGAFDTFFLRRIKEDRQTTTKRSKKRIDEQKAT